jgi:hypothetical protein
MHGGGDFGGSFGGHGFGGGHHADGDHQQHHAGDKNDGGQVIPLFGDEGQSGRRLLRRPRGPWGRAGDAVIILVAVLVVVGIATLIFH